MLHPSDGDMVQIFGLVEETDLNGLVGRVLGKRGDGGILVDLGHGIIMPVRAQNLADAVGKSLLPGFDDPFAGRNAQILHDSAFPDRTLSHSQQSWRGTNSVRRDGSEFAAKAPAPWASAAPSARDGRATPDEPISPSSPPTSRALDVYEKRRLKNALNASAEDESLNVTVNHHPVVGRPSTPDLEDLQVHPGHLPSAHPAYSQVHALRRLSSKAFQDDGGRYDLARQTPLTVMPRRSSNAGLIFREESGAGQFPRTPQHAFATLPQQQAAPPAGDPQLSSREVELMVYLGRLAEDNRRLAGELQAARGTAQSERRQNGEDLRNSCINSNHNNNINNNTNNNTTSDHGSRRGAANSGSCGFEAAVAGNGFVARRISPTRHDAAAARDEPAFAPPHMARAASRPALLRPQRSQLAGDPAFIQVLEEDFNSTFASQQQCLPTNDPWQ
ncbi:hypothetical protein DIPPA_25738 [Diplonema papillatum]|nr:hypothetical protein DIPPA_25738 [Diplonema papillatum]|eukprot:gene20799-32052_t